MKVTISPAAYCGLVSVVSALACSLFSLVAADGDDDKEGGKEETTGDEDEDASVI